MLQDLEPYPAYIPSHSWQGEVPSHWRLASMRALAREVSVSGVPDEPMLSVSIKHGVTPQSVLLAQSGKRDGSNVDRSSYKLVEPGDVAYNKMRAWQGAAGLSAYRGIVSPAYVVLRPDLSTCDPLYLHHLLRLPGYAAEAARWSHGISSDQWSLRPEHFRLIPVAVPPIEEQQAIVTYLSHAHQRINKAISTKRRLIALLEEHRQAVADAHVLGAKSQAATKDSGLPWLGTIPEHWSVAPLKRYWSVIDCKHLTVPFFDEGFPLVSVTQAQRFTLDVSDAKLTDRKSLEMLWECGRRPRRGDLIYCRNVAPGKATVVLDDLDAAMGQDVALLRSDTDDAMFLNYFLRSAAMREQMRVEMVGSTFSRINVDQVRSLTIVRPPLAEQRAIVERIKQAVKPFDLAVATARREITFLEQFRTTLTTDVVNGQFDVRAIAANLPDLDDEEAAVASVDTNEAVLDYADDAGMEDE